jgi:hypothetical protein
MSGMNTLLTSAVVLADSVDLDRDTVTPGVLGFLTVAAIGAALYFLMRSMSGKLVAVRGAQEAEEAEKARADGDAADGAKTDGEPAEVAAPATGEADSPKDAPKGDAPGGSADDTARKA